MCAVLNSSASVLAFSLGNTMLDSETEHQKTDGVYYLYNSTNDITLNILSPILRLGLLNRQNAFKSSSLFLRWLPHSIPLQRSTETL